MERNRISLMTEDDRSNSASSLFAPRKGQVTRKIIKQPGSLEIIENGGHNDIKRDKLQYEASSRSWSRASVGSIPPRSDSSLSRRTLTPTKQISLQAVKRKEEISDPFIDDDVDIDLDSVTFDASRHRFKKWTDGDGLRSLSMNSFTEDDEYNDSGKIDAYSKRSTTVESIYPVEKSFTDHNTERISEPETKNNTESQAATKGRTISLDKAGEIRKEESSSEDDDDEEEEEKLKAPNELLMEFLDCLMKQDFLNAEKLCKMILLYEPENPEALKFQPLIEEKMKLDAEAAAASEEEGDDDDDDDDDSDEDDDDSSSDDDSSEEDDDDDDNDDKNKATNVPSAQWKHSNSMDTKGANSTRVWKPAS